MQNRNLLVLGQISLALGILGQFVLRNYIEHNTLLDFFAGLCIGLSLVLNIAFLIRNRKK